jgi:hypothetical protein
MPEIETLNKFFVAVGAGKVIIMRPPMQGALTPDDAMLLAAYLVSMAEMDATHKFEDVLKAVRNC